MQVGEDVLAREIEAGRQARLEQQARGRGLGDDVAVDLDPDRSRGQAGIDAVERIARVGDDRVLLLVPGVERREVERHVAGQILVREPEPGAHPIVDRDRLTRGRVHAERDPRVQHARRLIVRRGRLPQLGPDVLDGHGVGRDDTARLPDEDRPRAVDDRLRAEARTHALLDRLVAKLAACVGE